MLRLSLSEAESDTDYNITDSGTFKKGNLIINSTWKNLKYEDLDMKETLGFGAGGSVCRAIHKSIPSIEYAVKTISISNTEQSNQVAKELEALEFCNSKYIVGFFGAFFREGIVSLVLEYMDAGSLKDIYDNFGKLPEPIIASIAYQVLQGLKYLHKEKHVVHRDLKPHNILMNKTGEFKITDFGVSTTVTGTQEQCSTFTGTFTYMSPERLFGQPYSFPSDCWSLGLIILELAIGRFPLSKQDTSTPLNFWEMTNFLQNHPMPTIQPSDGYSEEICDFVAHCLKKNPKERPSIVELLEHSFITNYCREGQPFCHDYQHWVHEVVQRRQHQLYKQHADEQLKKQLLRTLQL